MASRERIQIMANPQLVGDILLEGLRVKKESEDRIVEISKELELLYQQNFIAIKYFTYDIVNNEVGEEKSVNDGFNSYSSSYLGWIVDGVFCSVGK